MLKRHTLPVLFIFFGAAGCASVPTNFEYAGDSEEALLAHELDGVEYIIAPVDLANKSVSKKQSRLGNGTTIYSKYIDGKYGLKSLTPGTYAVVNSLTRPSSLGHYTDTCYEDFAPTFTVKAGTVNVMPSFVELVQGDAVANDKVLKQASETFAKYPKVTSNVEYVDFYGFIDISEKESADVFRNSCGSGSSFKFLAKDIETASKLAK